MNARSCCVRRLLQIGAFATVFHCLLAIGVVLLPVATANAQVAAAAAQGPIRIVAFGDSLTAGYRLPSSEAFPVKLEKALRARGHRVEIANAGVSGDTTAAGLERLDWAVPDGAHLVILELGANDALRGLDPAAARRNLEAIIKRIKDKGARVLLAGMRAPRNWGEDYVRRFEGIFPDLARVHGLPLYPFFLEGVAMKPSLNLNDGMHPNAKGVDEIVRGILPLVEKSVVELRAVGR